MTDNYGVLGLVWFMVMLLWNYKAPDFTPFIRHIIGGIVVFVAAILFAFLIPYWKFMLAVCGFVVGVFFFAEYFPKNKEKHRLWREKVTMEQDLMVMAGSLLIVIELIVMI